MVTILKPGTKVRKLSGKPFKSKEKIGTIESVIDHPMRPGHKAYVLGEDHTYVSVDQCISA